VINVAELWKAILAQLGAEGTRRYIPRRDGIYAINGAQRTAEALITPLLAERKGSEESLSELQETRIFQTNTFGGLSLDSIWSSQNTQITYQIWSVMALYYRPLISQPFTPGVPDTPSPLLPPSKTYIRNDLVYQPGGVDELPVKRMTMEQVAVANRNKFMAGNERTAATRPSIGYYIQGNRSDNDNALYGGREVVFTPRSLFVPTPRFVAMSYLRSAPVLALTDLDVNGNFPATLNIPYPASLFNVIRDLALNEISVKQGDGTNLYQVTSQQIGNLLRAQN
jgi:hypothetical protein